jgi:hypothetical protein
MAMPVTMAVMEPVSLVVTAAASLRALTADALATSTSTATALAASTSASATLAASVHGDGHDRE